jgi:hypothetical protein
MASPIDHMTIVRYYRDGRHWDTERVESPTWADVESAVRRMDHYCFPIVQLNTTDDDQNNTDLFNIIGGDGRWALFQLMGEWQYVDPDSDDDEEVRLWRSDQGYCCEQRNVLTDVEQVLRITRAYFDTGSYAGLDEVV